MNTQYEHQENIPIAVVGISHHTADVQTREKAIFTEKQQTKIIKYLSKEYSARGVVVLSTCNRIEIYLCGRKALKYINDICQWVDQFKNEIIFCDENIAYLFKGERAIHHFYRVISSLDSQMVGEPQITGQVKEAYEKSHALNHTDALINKMYNFGMQVEKLVRTKTFLTDGAVSISFAGVELARKIFGDLKQTTVLLIGAGETAELIASHFMNREVGQIFVANRTYEKGRQLAKKFHGESIQFENMEQALDRSQIVIAATSSSQYVIERLMLEGVAERRDYKPIFLIDLSMPRNIDPSASDIDGVFLYNMDDLQEIANKNIERREKEIPKAEKIVKDQVLEYIKWYETLPAIQTITQLSHYFEEIRASEFERLKNRFPQSSQIEAEYLSKSLMKKFLHQHIVTLRGSNGNPKRQKQYIDLVGEIYRLNGSESKTEKKK